MEGWRSRDCASASFTAVHGVSAQTLYLWRKRSGELETVDVQRLRALLQESARLREPLAERDLANRGDEGDRRKNGERTRSPAAGGICSDVAKA
jgi:hypothetical protein